MTNEEKTDFLINFLDNTVLRCMENDLDAELEELKAHPYSADQLPLIFTEGYYAAMKCIRRIAFMIDDGGDIEAIFKNASKEEPKEEAVNE